VHSEAVAETRESGNLIVTGKPDCLAGLNLDRFQAEGLAAIVSGNFGASANSQQLRRLRFRASVLSDKPSASGWRAKHSCLVALSDNSGGLYRADGLIFDDIRSRYDREPVLFGYSEAEAIAEPTCCK